MHEHNHRMRVYYYLTLFYLLNNFVCISWFVKETNRKKVSTLKGTENFSRIHANVQQHK